MDCIDSLAAADDDDDAAAAGSCPEFHIPKGR